MSSASRYAIIPTHNRPTELRSLVTALYPQVDVIVVIDNASDPPMTQTDLWELVDETTRRTHALHVIRDEEQPPNLYRLWNVALDACDEHARATEHGEWDIGVLNDDAAVPEGWFDVVASGLRGHPTAVVASTGAHGRIQAQTLLSSGRDGSVFQRMCPHAFVVRGEVGLRADESFRWWWGDTDWDWQARLAGGVLLLPGPLVKNTHANSQTHGELARQAGVDRETFARKWGTTPW